MKLPVVQLIRLHHKRTDQIALVFGCDAAMQPKAKQLGDAWRRVETQWNIFNKAVEGL